MSKNLTRKGLAFGALVALAATAISGAPASADTTGPITLVPNAGTTFNSILQSGITLKSEIDPALTATADQLSFLVTNADAAPITATLTGGGTHTTVKQDVLYSDTAPANGTATGVADARGAVGVLAAESTKKYLYIAGTTANITSEVAANTLAIATSETTKNVVVKVQAWLDSDEDGVVDTFEQASDVETVTLYALSNVSASTKISYLVRSNSAFAVETVYDNNINPFAVAGRTGAKLFKNGSVVDITDDANDTTADGDSDDISAAAITATADAYTSESNIGIAKNVITVGAATNGDATDFNYDATGDVVADFGAGTYTAQAYFNTTGTTWVAVGAASATIDLSNGINADVDTLDASVVETANLDFDGTSTLGVRTGTKTFDIKVQAQDNSVTLEKSNLKVRATVSVSALTSGAVTVSGSSASLVKDGSTVAYGFTDSKGVATFTINNSVGTKNDVVAAKFEILDGNGVWVDAETVTATWADATLASWSAKPGTYVSGANVTVKFAAKDQFDAPVSIDDSAALSVVAVASVAGVEKPLTYSKTVSVTSGVAEFTFANFATAGSSAQLKAVLKAGASDATPTTGSATIIVNVYNSLATDKITVSESFSNAITYKDYVTGDSTDSAVAAKLVKVAYASADYTTITGTVTNTNTVGQPGVAVVVSGSGLLFKAGDIYATDKITAYANEYGVFTVDVFSHKVNVKGIKVDIAADGKTASTLLKTFLPTSLAAANLKFDLSVPALLVKNTTYAVVATLTDKWGNPVNANDTDETVGGTDFAVSFVGTGSVEVNSSSTTLYKDFGKDGKVTVFVRSVKDIAGPGSINATLGSAFEYATTVDSTNTAAAAMVSSIATDDTATAWDESLWSNSLTTDVEILEKKPTASISKGSKSSTVVVKNANGTTIKVVRGSKVATKVATSNSYKVTLKGGTGTVKVYVNGVKVASK